MANAGRVSIVPKGDYVAGTAYKRLDLVRYNNCLYIAKKENTGVTPGTDSNTWMLANESAQADVSNCVEQLEFLWTEETSEDTPLTKDIIDGWFSI